MKITPETVVSTRLVKSEDLNHHGTLFAGRASEWFVEAGFISAAKLINPENVVCLKIHGMTFKKPIRLGEILRFESKIVYTGITKLVSYVHILNEKTRESLVSGFITFVNVNNNSKSEPHYFVINIETDEDVKLYNEAKELWTVNKYKN